MINHSWSYLFAISAGFIEYFIEIYFFENIKNKKIILILAAIMMTTGHIFRMGAFICARSNFHHQVQWKKANNHVLVTSGIYSISRHPSYFGFFLFALGAQVCLSNFICIITHSIVLWNFFNERIK